MSPAELGFDGETHFSRDTKKMVIDYLLNSNEGSEMQRVAQSVIESGWVFLLPSVDERANTLCGLLKSRNCKYIHRHEKCSGNLLIKDIFISGLKFFFHINGQSRGLFSIE